MYLFLDPSPDGRIVFTITFLFFFFKKIKRYSVQQEIAPKIYEK